MKRILAGVLASTFMPVAAMAASFERPVPQAQTDVAEFWYLIASIALILTLGAIQLIISKR